MSRNISFKRCCSAIVTPIIHEFPFFLLFFVIFGLLFVYDAVGLIRNYIPMVARGFWGQLGLLFLYDYLMTSLIYHTGSRGLKYVFYALVLGLYGVNTFLVENFGYRINLNALILLLETNGREASEFLNTYLFSKASLSTYQKIAVRLVAVVAFEWIWFRYLFNRQSSHQRLVTLLTVPVLLLVVWGCISFSAIVRICQHETAEHFFHQQQIEDIRPKDPFSTTFLSFYALHLVGHEMDMAIKTTRNLRPVTPVDKNDSLDVVLIIGESSNKWHYSIYGYNHDTTPRLSEEACHGNLFVFSDVVSPFSMTSPSMKNFLCCNSLSDGESWALHPFFPAIFKSACYQVFFWDNQKTVEPDASYTVSLNSFLYNKDLARQSYTTINDSTYTYDDELIHSFEQASLPSSDHRLVIFHLMGQHFQAKERYPHVGAFERFTADSIHRPEPFLQDREKRQRVAEYDNAVLYNDSVVRHVINLYRDRNSVIVFLSDHGEETYDYKDAIFRYYEGDMTEGWLRNVQNIPFVIWCSDTYIHKHEETVEAIRKAIDRPFMIDNLCHLLFHLGEIHSDYYIPERDLISDQFKPRKRIIEDMFFKKFDYDEVKNNK